MTHLQIHTFHAVPLVLTEHRDSLYVTLLNGYPDTDARLNAKANYRNDRWTYTYEQNRWTRNTIPLFSMRLRGVTADQFIDVARKAASPDRHITVHRGSHEDIPGTAWVTTFVEAADVTLETTFTDNYVRINENLSFYLGTDPVIFVKQFGL